jgi:hypothetical protein
VTVLSWDFGLYTSPTSNVFLLHWKKQNLALTWDFGTWDLGVNRPLGYCIKNTLIEYSPLYVQLWHPKKYWLLRSPGTQWEESYTCTEVVLCGCALGNALWLTIEGWVGWVEAFFWLRARAVVAWVWMTEMGGEGRSCVGRSVAAVGSPIMQHAAQSPAVYF